MAKICVQDSEGVKRFVEAKFVSDYDPEGKLKIFKVGVYYALIRMSDLMVMLTDCREIQQVANGMSYYTDKHGDWGILNDRGEVTCPAGVLESSRSKKK